MKSSLSGSAQHFHAARRQVRRNVWPKAVLFFLTLFSGLVFSLILPLRPTSSERELRDLTPFPQFSVEDLKTGEFFRGIEAWFSDTFPGRDTFLEINRQVVSLYGMRSVEIQGEIHQGDDIPSTPFTGK